jgi:3-hydroxyacyl-CoA dehydrogenase
VARARARLGRDGPLADRKLVDCVEAALTLPFAAALEFEREMFADCLADTATRARLHLMIAERRIGEGLGAQGPGGLVLTPAAQAVADRLRRAMGRAAAALVRANVPPEVVDGTAVGWGLPQGPFDGAAPGPVQAAVLRRLVAALMAEGARALGEGQVARAADVDVIAVHGLGLARATGGPMFTAERMGLAGLARDMRTWVVDDRIWAVPVALDQAARADGCFASG